MLVVRNALFCSVAIPTMSGRQQKVMLQPINVIFRHLQQQTRVSLWLYDNVEYRLEGKIIVRMKTRRLTFRVLMNL